MPDSEEEELLRQRDRDLAEIYPTPEAWESSYPVLEPPDDPEERRQYDDLREIYPDRPVKPAGEDRAKHEENTVNEKQRALVNKAAQKTAAVTQVQHASPLPSTQDRVKESLARANQERLQQTMAARQKGITGVAPNGPVTVQRRSPTNGLPPLDKSRESGQDSPKKGVSMERD